jgi:methylmalonyl-CoA/ethylmalonyl-CoA epimerase
MWLNIFSDDRIIHNTKGGNMRKNTKAKSPFSKLIHLAIVVKDIDKTIERLQSLGIGPFKSTSVTVKEKPLFHGKPSDAEVRESKTVIGGLEIELLQPVKGESPFQEFLDSKGEGIHHIAFAVDDLEKELTKLTKQGATILLSVKMEGMNGAYLDFGVGGIIVELKQFFTPSDSLGFVS